MLFAQSCSETLAVTVQGRSGYYAFLLREGVGGIKNFSYKPHQNSINACEPLKTKESQPHVSAYVQIRK